MHAQPNELTAIAILRVHSEPILSYTGPLRRDPTITAIVRMLTAKKKPHLEKFFVDKTFGHYKETSLKRRPSRPGSPRSVTSQVRSLLS
jgi:hypothetical protein